MKSYLLIASALLSSPAFADQMVTLQDGKQILLKDDFTWQYVAQKQAKEVATTSEIAVLAQQRLLWQSQLRRMCVVRRLSLIAKSQVYSYLNLG